MGADHASGAIKGNRSGCSVVAQTFLINRANNPTAVNNKLMTIPGTVANPIAYRIRNVVVVPETTTGASTLSVGSSSGGTQFLNAVDEKATAGTNHVPTNNVLIAEADVDIWAAVARADANGAGGRSVLTVELWDVNIVAPSSIE